MMPAQKYYSGMPRYLPSIPVLGMCALLFPYMQMWRHNNCLPSTLVRKKRRLTLVMTQYTDI